jgi:uncharacterized membrane protein
MFGIGFYELIILILFFGVIPWIFAFVDILKNDFKGNNKLIWLLAVIFVPFLGSIVYLFIGRKQKIGRRNDDSNA